MGMVVCMAQVAEVGYMVQEPPHVEICLSFAWSQHVSDGPSPQETLPKLIIVMAKIQFILCDFFWKARTRFGVFFKTPLFSHNTKIVLPHRRNKVGNCSATWFLVVCY